MKAPHAAAVRSAAAASLLEGGGEDLAIPAGPRYERRAEVGGGGLGRVTLAWDRWLGREVALKEARDDAHRALLLREARVSAKLEHPGILPIHDTGIGDDGSPFFVMPLVRGRSLADHLAVANARRDRGALLRAFLAVVETVAFAHSHDVFHLDLKPANVMLGPWGRTLVIDWGMAAGPGLADLPEAPTRGGTPRYMSEAHARGAAPSAHDDVFSLGAMLYEIVVGRPAFAGIDDLASASAPRSLPTWPADAPRALGAVVGRALGVGGNSAYASAAPFAADLTRYLDDRPIGHYAYSPVERAVLFVRRWRVASAVAGVALVALLVVSGVLFDRMADARDRAEDLLRKTLVTAAGSEADAEHRDAARALATEALALGPAPEAVGLLATVPEGSAHEVFLGDIPCVPRDVVPEIGAVVCAPRPADGRVALWQPDGGGWLTSEGALRDPVFAGDGTVVAVSDRDYVFFKLLDGSNAGREERFCPGVFRPAPGFNGGASISSGCAGLVTVRETRSLRGPGCGRGGMTAAALAPDGGEHVVGCDDGVIIVGKDGDGGNDASESLVLPTGLGPPWLGMTAIAFVPGTRELLIGTQQGWLLRLDRDDPRHLRMWKMAGLVQRIAVAPDGGRAVFFGDGGGPVVMDVRAWAPLSTLGGDVVAGRFEADGRFLAAGRTLRRIDFAPLSPRWVALSRGITSVDVSPDGRLIAVGQAEWLSTVNIATRRPVAHASWQAGVIKAVAFDDAGGIRAHGVLEDTEIRFENEGLAGSGRRQELPDSLRVVWLADGTAVILGWDVGARMWRNGHELRDLATPVLTDLIGERVSGVVAALGTTGEVYVAADLAGGGRFEHCDTVPGARRLALRRVGGRTEVLAATADLIVGVCGATARYEAPAGALVSVAADAAWVIAGDRDGRVFAWTGGAPMPAVSLRAHAGRVSALALLPNGRGFISGGWDGRIMFWTVPLTGSGP